MSAKNPVIVYVAKCILDPYARAKRASSLLNVGRLISFVNSMEIGIYSYSCPGLLFYGFGREVEEDTVEYREFCRSLAEKLVNEITTMKKLGYRVIGIIGVDPSPTCAVEEKVVGKDDEGRSIYGSGQGIFVEELVKLMRKNKLEIPLMSWTPYVPKINLQFGKIKKNLLSQLEKI